MARPIMFSQTFPSYHPRAGEPTYFVEKIWKYLIGHEDQKAIRSLTGFLLSHVLEDGTDPHLIFPKLHTIRKGHRWKENDICSPRIWSGPPYRSQHIPFVNDLPVRQVWDILILPSREVFINGQLYGFYGSPEVEKLAYHDGLSPEDFQNWFCHLPFDGQIISWDRDLEY